MMVHFLESKKFRKRYLLFWCLFIFATPLAILRVKAYFPPKTDTGMRFKVAAYPLVNRIFSPPLFNEVLEMHEQEVKSVTEDPTFYQGRESISRNGTIFIAAYDFKSPVPLKFRGDVFVGYGYTAARKTPYVIEA